MTAKQANAGSLAPRYWYPFGEDPGFLKPCTLAQVVPVCVLQLGGNYSRQSHGEESRPFCRMMRGELEQISIVYLSAPMHLLRLLRLKGVNLRYRSMHA